MADVIASAFDSAGQRCSALRVLCLQEETAERTLGMLKGALAELSLGRTDRLAIDIGPVITAEARAGIEAHIETMRRAGHDVTQTELPDGPGRGTFVAPTIIEISSIGELKQEVFGPVLHVLRFRRRDMPGLIDEINATGYGLTFGLHTRLDQTIAQVTGQVRVGNIYVNRNIIGAVVGVQPFGGRGLSGTGPKAGGPLYLGRLVAVPPEREIAAPTADQPVLEAFAGWLEGAEQHQLAPLVRRQGVRSGLGLVRELNGPVGERNLYALHPRGTVLLLPESVAGLYHQIAACLATGNRMMVADRPEWRAALEHVPAAVLERIALSADWAEAGPFAGALVEGAPEVVRAATEMLAKLEGPLILVQGASGEELAVNEAAYCLDWLVEEVSSSINTTAAGGNASLMSIG